jgi:hypothetical protein
MEEQIQMPLLEMVQVHHLLLVEVAVLLELELTEVVQLVQEEMAVLELVFLTHLELQDNLLVDIIIFLVVGVEMVAVVVQLVQLQLQDQVD